MEKTIFEQMGGTYSKVGDYYLPNLITDTEEFKIGIWGQRHLLYLKMHRKITYANLLTSGRLNSYLSDINKQAEDMLFRLVKQMAKCEGVKEQLKVSDTMLWVRKMNNIRNRATEIINAEIIFPD